jgi:hypothetical protein
VVVALLAAGCAGSDDRSSRPAGPLRAGPELKVGISGKVGKPYTFGSLDLRNPTDATMVLEGVRWRARTPGVSVLGVLVAGEDRPVNIGASEEFPDHRLAGFTHPVSGYRLAPQRKGGRGTQVLIGVRPSHAGRTVVFDGLQVLYRLGGHRYAKSVHATFVLCLVARPPLGRECT